MEHIQSLGKDGWEVLRVLEFSRPSRMLDAQEKPIPENVYQFDAVRKIGSRSQYFYKVFSHEILLWDLNPDVMPMIYKFYNELGQDGWKVVQVRQYAPINSGLANKEGAPVPKLPIQVLAFKETTA